MARLFHNLLFGAALLASWGGCTLAAQEVQVLHWWTSGEEAAALGPLEKGSSS